MGEFRKTNVKVFGKNVKTTPDTIYWKQLGEPVFIKEFGPVDYIDFSSVEPHYFAVTASVRVQVYNPLTKLIYKNLSRFQKSAYGASFRSDGRLICSGGEENNVKLFEISSKSLLRVFKGHTSPVHRCFFTSDNIHIASFGDDRLVSLWDVASEKKLNSFQDHTDYVRAGAVSPVSPDIILSGGYDNIVKMYDTRSSMTVFSLNHGSPVQSVIFLPTGGLFLSAGGNDIKVWDAISGGRLLAKITQHHKTVTSLCLSSNGRRIMSGGLDRHVNVYDVTTFQPVHSMNYPNSILSLGISANDETLAVGMVDGLVSVSRRETEVKLSRRERKKPIYKFVTETVPATVDVHVPFKEAQKLAKYDYYLKRFDHTKSLSVVLTPFMTNRKPHVTVAILQELINRKTLIRAIAGRDDKILIPYLRFIIRYIGDYRFIRVLIDAANIFMDAYEDTLTECDPQIIFLSQKLAARLNEEIELSESLITIDGMLKLMISASSAGRNTQEVPQTQLAAIRPSKSAQDFVVNVT